MALGDVIHVVGAIQGQLFPWLEEIVGPLTPTHCDIVKAMHVVPSDGGFRLICKTIVLHWLAWTLDRASRKRRNVFFDANGFAASAVDDLTEAAGVSSRTLYKHCGSKQELIARVLARRHTRFLATTKVGSVAELFDALGRWIEREGAHGCLFLRAAGEGGIGNEMVANRLVEHKAAVRERISELAAREVQGSDLLVDQLLVLFEGATHAAVYRGPAAVIAARDAATSLIEAARRR